MDLGRQKASFATLTSIQLLHQTRTTGIGTASAPLEESCFDRAELVQNLGQKNPLPCPEGPREQVANLSSFPLCHSLPSVSALFLPFSVSLYSSPPLPVFAAHLTKSKSRKNRKVHVRSVLERPRHQETFILNLLQVDLHLAQNKYPQ